mgnify:CR=1 FL=1
MPSEAVYPTVLLVDRSDFGKLLLLVQALLWVAGIGLAHTVVAKAEDEIDKGRSTRLAETALTGLWVTSFALVVHSFRAHKLEKATSSSLADSMLLFALFVAVFGTFAVWVDSTANDADSMWTAATALVVVVSAASAMAIANLISCIACCTCSHMMGDKGIVLEKSPMSSGF